MAYIAEATLETAIENVSLTLIENKTLPNGEAVWQAWQEVLSHLDKVVAPDASYGALVAASRGTEFGGV